MGRVGAEPGRTRFGLRIIAFASVLLVSASARGQTGVTADDLARRHFESGVAYLEESDYENALRAFYKAHDLSKRAEILLNIAVVQERRGDVPGAIAALRQYISEAPNSDDVETVELRIRNLEKRRLAAPPPVPAPAPVAPPLAATPPPAARAPAPSAPSSAPSSAVRPSRTPIFAALSVGAIATGGAVLTGLLAQNDYQRAKSECSPRCSDADLASGRVLALTSTLLTGVALAGVGVGVTLLLLEEPRDQPASGSLALSLVPVSTGARASAAWSF
jgi:tetratricopeptide (TPR) repeat protein